MGAFSPSGDGGAGRTRSRPAAIVATVVAIVVATTGVVGSGPAAAAPITVTTTADGGAGSLRDAFALASASGSDDEIVLQPGETYLLDDCTEGDLDHTGGDALAVDGQGATIVQTCPGERVIESSGDLTVVDLTVSGGEAPGGLGGGIAAGTARVTMVRSTVRDNEASTGGGVAAIRVTLVDSTISANTASSTGGGVWADQVVTATNTTIVGNEAGVGGGGVTVVNGTAFLRYASVADNAAPGGANLQVQAAGDELDAFASVLADPRGGGADCELAGGVVTTSRGANVSSDGSCGFGGGSDDLPDAGDVALGPLGTSGGTTETRVPGPGSPLIDRADCASAPEAVPTDQRGIQRPQGPRCDTGAVEVEAVTPTPPTTTEPGPPVPPGVRDDGRRGAAPAPAAQPRPGRAALTG